jgi:TolA-binding protein
MSSQLPPEEGPLTRLRDEPSSEAGAGRAGSLLRQMGDPPALSRTQLVDIAARLSESRRPSRWRAPLGWAFAGASFAALATLVWIRLASSGTTTAQEGRSLTVPDGLTVTLHGAHGETMLVFGPTHAWIADASPAHDELMVIDEGRVALRTSATPASVTTHAGQRVTVAAGALVELVAQHASLRVAAYDGIAQVSFAAHGRSLDLPPGFLLDGGQLRRIEDLAPAELAPLRPAPVEAAPAELAPPRPASVEAAPAELAPESSNVRAVPAVRDANRRKPTRVLAARSPAVESVLAPIKVPTQLAPAEETRPAPKTLAVVAPKITTPTPVPQPAAPVESPLATESRLLSAALRQLRTGDAAGALHALEDYQRQFPTGGLHLESQRARVEALLALDRRRPALEVLDQMDGDLGTGELLVVRGELRAELHRERAAITDFDAALVHAEGRNAERALYGRASARARVHDDAGARADLETYLHRFPAGQFAVAAKRALDR